MKEAEILTTVVEVMSLEQQAIEHCIQRLSVSLDAFSVQKSPIVQAVLLIHDCLNRGGKIIVSGLGKSGKIAQKIAATFSSTGSPALFLHPTEGLHGDLGIVADGDILVALSYTGNTGEILDLLQALRQRDVKVIGITGHANSQLAKASAVWIDAAVQSEACPHNLAPTASTTLALVLGDAMAVALMRLRGFAAEAFAKNHPGGSLGRKISLTVNDLMKSGDAVPTVLETASVEEVLVKISDKKLGAVLVVDSARLVGIITDGDIRRALQQKEKFFSLLARDLMTRQPTTALKEMKAIEAMGLMENRSSQISVLPVINSDGHWLGLIRLHDLVQSF